MIENDTFILTSNVINVLKPRALPDDSTYYIKFNGTFIFEDGNLAENDENFLLISKTVDYLHSQFENGLVCLEDDSRGRITHNNFIAFAGVLLSDGVTNVNIIIPDNNFKYFNYEGHGYFGKPTGGA